MASKLPGLKRNRESVGLSLSDCSCHEAPTAQTSAAGHGTGVGMTQHPSKHFQEPNSKNMNEYEHPLYLHCLIDSLSARLVALHSAKGGYYGF